METKNKLVYSMIGLVELVLLYLSIIWLWETYNIPTVIYWAACVGLGYLTGRYSDTLTLYVINKLTQLTTGR